MCRNERSEEVERSFQAVGNAFAKVGGTWWFEELESGQCGGAWPGCGGEAEESRAFWDGFSHQWLPLVRLKSPTSSPSPTLSIPLTLSTLLRYFAKIPPSWWRWGLSPRRKHDKRLDRWGAPLWASVEDSRLPLQEA